uniref:hypothetical protein n=1 Tax=Hafnia alvei TaxID=569 RepID=UPI0026735838|nr:hypothetical protein [Hafnia alvei]
MKKVLLITTLVTTALMPVISQAFGNRDAWGSGYAQGTAEYTILGKGQSQLYLACDSYGDKPEMLIFTDESGRQVSTDSNQRIIVKIDGEEATDVSETASHAGADNFAWMWDKLRAGKQITVSGDGVKSAIFTLKGAGITLPAYKDSSCVAEFTR